MADQVKYYAGKPENQKDPKAVNVHKGKDVAAPPPQKKPQSGKTGGKPPPTLNKPTQLHDASKQTLATSDPFAASNFALGITQREDHVRSTFMPSFAAATEVSRLLFEQLSIDDSQINKKMTPEALDYYTSCMIWARIISLKHKLLQPTTAIEDRIYEMLSNETFNLPEPLRLYLLTYGKITTVLGTHLKPTFPPLPLHVINWDGVDVPGFYAEGPADADTHNLYEEIPSLGVAISALLQAQQPNQGAWQPPAVPDEWTATTNMLGYRPTKNYRPESYAFVIDSGISNDEVVCNPPNSGFNFDLLRHISDLLVQFKTFKTQNVCLATMPEFGSTAQLALALPEMAAPTTNVRTLTTVKTINAEKEATLGVALTFAPRLEKTSDLLHYYVWSCCRAPVDDPPPEDWFNNRNARRIVPAIYMATQFTSLSLDAANYRSRVIQSFVTQPR